MHTWLRYQREEADWWKHLLLIIISIFLFFPFVITIIISFKMIKI